MNINRKNNSFTVSMDINSLQNKKMSLSNTKIEQKQLENSKISNLINKIF